jgi:formylglycine-generating enzyme required for sulfatase activity
MHGNVSEWCQDLRGGPQGGEDRVVRGGVFF